MLTICSVTMLRTVAVLSAVTFADTGHHNREITLLDGCRDDRNRRGRRRRRGCALLDMPIVGCPPPPARRRTVSYERPSFVHLRVTTGACPSAFSGALSIGVPRCML